MPTNKDIFFSSHAERQFSEIKVHQNRDHSVDSNQTNTKNTSWEEWDDYSCVVLLGEPGSGKTTEFLYQFEAIRKKGKSAYISKWQNWLDGDEVFETLNDQNDFSNAINSGQQIWWFIDALDEGRIKTEKAFEVVQKGLRKLQQGEHLHLVKLRLSCRSRDWRSTEANQLANVFPRLTSRDDVAVVQLLPLNDRAISTLALEKLHSECEVKKFVDVLNRQRVRDLAGHPLLLSMMLSSYQQGKATTSYDRTNLYKQSIEQFVQENNSERREQLSLVTTPQKRISIAKLLAVRAVFGGYDAIVIPDKDTPNPQALAAENFDVTPQEFQETLNTPLFTKNTQNGFNFFHRSLAEFLSALSIDQQLEERLLLSRIKPLFPIEHGVIPSPIRETAAWLAGLNKAFRCWLIEQDPVTAAQGDTIQYSSSEREKLILVLAERFGERDWQREFDRFGDLAHGVSETVLLRLLQRDRSQAVRLMIIDMIDAANINNLFPALLTIGLDSTENHLIRVKAIMILVKKVPTMYLNELLPLLQLPEAQDPEDEIAGALLYQLYPTYITTKQAIGALRPPRKKFLFGQYRLFWEYKFLELIPDCGDDRRITIDALITLLTEDADFISMKAYANIYMSLLAVELNNTTLEIEHLGPWLIVLADWIWHGGRIDQKIYEDFSNTLKARHNLGVSLLRWRLTNWEINKEFLLWLHMPFLDELSSEIDNAIWVEMCRNYANQPNIGTEIFEYLIRNPELTPLEDVLDLAETYPVYLALWRKVNYCDLDSPIGKLRREQRDYAIQNQVREDEIKASTIANIEVFRSGDINALILVIGWVEHDLFGSVPFQKLSERFGLDVAMAVREGFVKAWECLDDTSSLWPLSNSLPNLAICVGIGFSEQNPSGIDDLELLNENQLDYLIWRMLRNDPDMPVLLPKLWLFNSEKLWLRLAETLIIESNLPPGTEHSLIWGQLARVNPLPSGFADSIAKLLVAQGLPIHARARLYAVNILLSLGGSEIKELISTTARNEWCSNSFPAPWFEETALISLAAWWWLDAPIVHEILETELFQGNRYRPRIIGFVIALQGLQGNNFPFNSNWSDIVSWNIYAKLLPLLYDMPPAEINRIGSGWVSPDDQFVEARKSLVMHLTKAPSQLSAVWFNIWKNDSRFGVYRDWFSHLHSEILQRNVDESWTPLDPKVIDSILDGHANLIRNDADVAELINEVISKQLVPAFRSDFSLAPLLLDGTKKAGRTFKDEKALQTAIYGQLIPMLKSQKVVGAREPEELDAKKPDLRISYVLDTGPSINIPIEIKWAHNVDVWSAPLEQIVKKYLQNPHDKYGVYIVGWAEHVTIGPNGEKPNSLEEFTSQLKHITQESVKETGKIITVHVIDISLIDTLPAA